MMLTGTEILVTGATGFIGGRLVEILAQQRGVNVRALVRDYSKAVRIARFPVTMVSGTIGTEDAIDAAVRGCAYVIHCAHDWGNPDENLRSAETLTRACERHQVKRLVYLSSMAVYEPLPDADVDESYLPPGVDWEYQNNKRLVEKEFLRIGRQSGVPVVILQPTLVYGPHSFPFTLHRIAQLRSGRVVLPDQGDGLCNLVYIDDVVQAILLSIVRDEAVGERFLISGGPPVTWRQFYGEYERMIGLRSVECMPVSEIQALMSSSTAPSAKVLRQDPRRLLRSRYVRQVSKLIRRILGPAVTDAVKQSIPSELHIPDQQSLNLYGAKATIRTDKARLLLGYVPTFDFRTGMDLTEQYVKWACL